MQQDGDSSRPVLETTAGGNAERHQAIAEGRQILREEVARLRERIAVLEYRFQERPQYSSDEVALAVAEMQLLTSDLLQLRKQRD